MTQTKETEDETMSRGMHRPVIAFAAVAALAFGSAGGSQAATSKLGAPHAASMQSPAGESATPKLPPKGNAPDAGKPAAGGDPLQDCLETWDAGTHMTKRQWEETCRRTLMEHPTVLQATGLKEEGRRRH
jgi:hypothetical protein